MATDHGSAIGTGIMTSVMRRLARRLQSTLKARHPLIPAILGFAMVASLLGLGAPTATAAPGLTMQVRAGFDGLGKVGGWVPVEIEIRNEGNDVRGEIQIQVQDTTTNRGTYTRPPTIYSVPAVLPRKSHKRLSMDIFLPSSALRTQARLVENGAILLEQDVQLSRVAAGDLICGVLSRSSNSLDFIPSLELPPPLRRARLAHLDISDIPSRPQLLGSLDCLILSNLSTVGMLDRQKEALWSWLNNGGLLIVAGGPSWQRTVSSLPSSILPVRLTGLTSVSSLGSMADFLKFELNESGPWLVSQSTVVDGTTLLEEDGVPLLVAARRGAGTIFYLALDPAGEPLRSWPGSITLWRYMLSHAAGGIGMSAAVASPFVSWGRTPRNALMDISSLNPPSPVGLIVVLLIYLALVGPGSYLLVHRFGRPTWTLVTVPVLTIVAVVSGLLISSANRDADVVVNQVSLIRAGPTGELGHARSYVSVLARRPGYYDLVGDESALVSSLFYPFPRDPNLESGGWGVKVLEGGSPALVDLHLSAGSLGTATVDNAVRFAGPLETELTATQQAVTGTITNQLGLTLSDVSLILDFQVTRLGDIAPGETKEVSIPLGRALSAGYGPPTSFASLLYPNTSKPRMIPTDGARRDVLDSLLGSGFNFSRLELSGLALLGWLDSSHLKLEARGGQASTIEGALYVTSLPVKLPRGYEGEVPAPIVIKRQLGANTASRQQFGTYDLAAGESIALQFSLPNASGRMLTERLYLNIDGRLRGAPSTEQAIGDISLFNWRTAEWEDWTVGVGTNEFLEPARFISGVGDVRLRYTFRPSAESRATGISFSRFDVTSVGLVR